MRVVRGKEKYPFSVGEIVETLQGAGVQTDEAIRIAREVDKHYRSRDKKQIELVELLDRLATKVEQRVAPEMAERLRAQTPPFVPLKIVEEDGAEGDDQVAEVFSRRALAGSLDKLGLSFKEANAVARQVEQSLKAQGVERLGKVELKLRVAVALEGLYGRDFRLRYEAEIGQPADLRVREGAEQGLPYSRGVLARSVMATGLDPELSHNLAKRVEEAMWQTGRLHIERREIRDEVTRLLIEEAGEEFARRYDLMRAVRQPGRPIVILIGGAAGVGKSLLAAELAYRLGIPRVVSTDAVRQALRSLISPELSPTLHSSTYDAWQAELLPAERGAAKPKRKRVIRGYQAQVQQLGTALGAIIERNIAEATSLVMEGAHLVPGIAPVGPYQATVVEMVLSVADESVHRRNFALREDQTRNQRTRSEYLEHFAEIRTLQDFIVTRAELHGVPAIEASDIDQAVDQALEHVLEVLFQESLQERDEAEDPGADDTLRQQAPDATSG